MPYADDTIVYTTGANISNVQTRLQYLTDKVNEWSNQNKLTINIEKTKSIVFTRNNIKPKLDIEINGTPSNK